MTNNHLEKGIIVKNIFLDTKLQKEIIISKNVVDVDSNPLDPTLKKRYI
jgi:hypothetical protein